MCLKLSLLLRVFGVICALITVGLVAGGLSSVEKSGSSQKGCYFNHPHSPVCIYTDGVSVLTVIVAGSFVILDCCLSLRRKRGKRFKRADMVLCVFMSVAWVSCGGTMAGFEAALSTKDKDLFKEVTQSMANAVIVMSWIGAVTWLLITVTVCCSDKEPQTAQGLMADPSDDDDITKSAENKPLLAKS